MNIPVFIIAIGFFILLNKHFGWNGYPKSSDELICDGISFVLLAMAFL